MTARANVTITLACGVEVYVAVDVPDDAPAHLRESMTDLSEAAHAGAGHVARLVEHAADADGRPDKGRHSAPGEPSAYHLTGMSVLRTSP